MKKAPEMAINDNLIALEPRKLKKTRFGPNWAPDRGRVLSQIRIVLAIRSTPVRQSK